MAWERRGQSVRFALTASLSVCLGSLALACHNAVDLGALPDSGPSTDSRPVISSLSTLELSVGDRLQFFGENFVPSDDGWTNVNFVGEFVPDDGSESNLVDLTVRLFSSSAGVLEWTHFGGYRVPFHPFGDKLGRFHGEVFAENELLVREGASPRDYAAPKGAETIKVVQTAESLNVTIRVLPSLVVLDNRAFGDDFVADCLEPSTVVLEGLAYALRVKALGFTPDSFAFTLGAGLLAADPVTGVWSMNGEPTQLRVPSSDDGGGRDEYAIAHRWAPVPRYHSGYDSSVRVVASSVGEVKTVEFPIIVRPAATPVLAEQAELAELSAPAPVSGCIPGGPADVAVSYRESLSETRSQSSNHAVARDVVAGLLPTPHRLSQFSDPLLTAPWNSSVRLSDLTQSGAPSRVTDLFSETTSHTREVSMDWSVLGQQAPTSRRLNAIYHGLEQRGLSPLPLPLPRASAQSGTPWPLRDMLGLAQAERSFGRALQVTGPWPGPTDSWGPSNYGRDVAVSRDLGRDYASALILSASIDNALGANGGEASVSSADMLHSEQQGFVWAGTFGTWYRQAGRHRTHGSYVVHDLCGSGTAVGESRVDDWRWAVKLGIGNSCPPPSNFPSAECRIAPCGQP